MRKCETSNAVQVTVTARDAYDNAVATGDAGFQMVSPPQSVIKPNTFSRDVTGAEALFKFRITAAAVYVIRFEDASGALVHQSRFRVQPGGVSHLNSRYLSFPPSFVVGQTWLATLQIRDAYDNVFVDYSFAAQFLLSATDTAAPDRSVPVRPPGVNDTPFSRSRIKCAAGFRLLEHVTMAGFAHVTANNAHQQQTRTPNAPTSHACRRP